MYAHHSLVKLAAEPASPDEARPLLLVHGLADDNVVAAHTLRLSAALLAAGRPHAVLPLTGATHMARRRRRRAAAAAGAGLPAPQPTQLSIFRESAVADLRDRTSRRMRAPPGARRRAPGGPGYFR